MKRREWTAKQKLEILQEAEQFRMTTTLRKHSIYSNTLYQWKEKYAVGSMDALKNNHYRMDPELKRLQKENEHLKALLADKELAFAIKEELLKNSQSRK
jgi:transposase-like protein